MRSLSFFRSARSGGNSS